jgi:hypothetical protein
MARDERAVMAGNRMTSIERKLLRPICVLGGVGATDPNRLHREQELTGTGFGYPNLFQAKVGHPVKDCGQHHHRRVLASMSVNRKDCIAWRI